jgi:hypothetical protein
MELDHSIINALKDARKAIDAVLMKNEYDYFKVDIDCAKLGNSSFVIKSPYLPTFLEKKFPKTVTDDLPAVYFFAIKSKTTGKEILEEYMQLSNAYKKDRENALAVHALKLAPPLNTDCLYVGKVKRNLRSRLGIHAGCYKVNRTAGLQLRHWAPKLKLKLEFHAFVFPKGLADLVDGLELHLSRVKNPMIGKQ